MKIIGKTWGDNDYIFDTSQIVNLFESEYDKEDKLPSYKYMVAIIALNEVITIYVTDEDFEKCRKAFIKKLAKTIVKISNL